MSIVISTVDFSSASTSTTFTLFTVNLTSPVWSVCELNDFDNIVAFSSSVG